MNTSVEWSMLHVVKNIIQFEIACFIGQGILADVSKLELQEYKFGEAGKSR